MHAHQHRSHGSAEQIAIHEGIIELAGDEGEPIILLGLEDGVGILLGDQFTLADFIGIGHAPRLDLDLSAIFQVFELDKNMTSVLLFFFFKTCT